MSNLTVEFFKRERERLLARKSASEFRTWLRATFKESPELVSDAVADLIAERLEDKLRAHHARGGPVENLNGLARGK